MWDVSGGGAMFSLRQAPRKLATESKPVGNGTAAAGVRSRRCAVDTVEFRAARPALWCVLAARRPLAAAIYRPQPGTAAARDEL